MGKNVFGGKGAKRGARVSNFSGGRNNLRVATEEGEEYAVVTKMTGNGCNVYCSDSVVRLCIIRGKFKGKGKSTNIIAGGTWVLVGTREWASEKEGAIPKCDLLEVYTHVDKERLKSSVGTVNWNLLIENDPTILDKKEAMGEEQIHFQTVTEMEYQNTMATAIATTSATMSNSAPVDRVYVDDI